MLRTRVITALILLAVLILALWPARPWGFAPVALLFVGAAMAEWLILIGFGRTVSIVAALVGTALVYGVDHLAQSDPVWLDAVLLCATLVWLFLTASLLARHAFPRVGELRPLYAVCALFLPGACALALLAAYRIGLVFMMSILVLVWAADIAAYFVGRAFGRHKLAPAISPGKTIEGALGGVAAVLLVAAAAASIPGLETTLFARLIHTWPILAALAAIALLVALSIVGDLFESHIKREAGVKDSSCLLPGHGGVLDRIDALLPVIPAALLLSEYL